MSFRPEPSDVSEITVVAHRGFAGRYPENTVAALRAAAAEGADAVELDAVPTADGTPVVFHDDRLDDLTDATGLVWETPTDRVCGAEVLASGHRVPTLAAAVAAVPDDALVNVELKNPGTTAIRPGERLGADERPAARDRWAPFVDRVLDVLDGVGNDLLVSSFCEGALAAVRARSTAPLAAVAWTDADAALSVAARYGADAVHPPWNLVAGTPFAGADYAQPGPVSVETDVVARAEAAGLAVNAWTVDTWYRADRLRAAGVDGLIADHPGLASPV